MSTILARRGFIGALAALPTVARAAAEKAGVTGPVGTAPSLSHGGAYPAPYADNAVEVRNQIARVLDRSRLDRQRKELKRNVTRLDADLASNRSLSLDAAIRIQAERNVQMMTDMELGWLEERAKALGIDFRSLLP